MPARSSIKSTSAALGARLASLWRTKLLLLALLWLAFGVPYLAVQRFPLREAAQFPLTAVDQWIGFHPGWVYAYQSAYLLIPLAPFLSVQRAELWVYTRGFLLMTAVAMGIFLLFPVAGPRPTAVPRDGAFGLLLRYDKPLNAFPSLHVGLVVHSLAFGMWLRDRAGRGAVGKSNRNLNAGGWALAAGTVWAVLIAYSTLATKQHYLVDIPVGVLLGGASQWCSSRLARVAPAAVQGSF